MSFTRAALLVLLALPLAATAQPEPPKGQSTPRVDRFGDPLPPGAVARLGTMRLRHDDTVRFVGYSGDGKLLLSASDSTLYFWDARTGKQVRRVPIKRSGGRSSPFRMGPSVLLSGDGKTVVLGVDTGDCAVIDVGTGKQLREFKIDSGNLNRFGPDGSAQPSLSHDGRLLLTFDRERFRDGKLKILDTTTGKVVLELTPKDKEKGGRFAAATLTRDGKAVVLVEGADFDRKNGKEAPETRFRVRDIATGNETRSFNAPAGAMVSELQFSPDGKTLAVSGQQGQEIRLLEAITGKERQKIRVKGNTGHTLVFSPDGKMLFVTDFAGVTQFDLQSGMEVRHFPLAGSTPGEDPFGPFGRRSPPAPPSVSPDGWTLALPALATVARYDLQTGKLVPGTEGHQDRIDSVAFGPKGDLVLIGGGDGALGLWEVGTGKRAKEFTRKRAEENEPKRPGRSQVMDVFRVRGAFAPDGKTIAGLWWGGELHVWDTDSGKLRHHLIAPGGHTSFAYSPDSRFAVTNGPGGSVRLWDLGTGKSVRQFAWRKDGPQRPPEFGPGDEGGVYTSAFSADGRVVLSGVMLLEPFGLRTMVTGWEVAGGRERIRLEAGMDIGVRGAVSFESLAQAMDTFILSFVPSPDGRLLAEAGFSSVKLRDLGTSKEVRVFGGAQVNASTAVFSPDGKLLLAGKQDGSIRIWDVATGTVVQDFPAHPSAVTALTFSADGKLLASGGRDTTVMLWDWEYVRGPARAPRAGAAVRVEALWAALSAEDGTKAFQVMQTLLTTPAETVEFLKGQLKPVPPVEAGRLQRLIADLDLNFRARQKAEQELEKLGDLAGKAIRDTLANPPSQEVRIRLERLLTRLEGAVVSAELLRELRAVEVLERIGTPEARALLETLARGAAGHRVTEDARRSLERLSKRAAAP